MVKALPKTANVGSTQIINVDFEKVVIDDKIKKHVSFAIGINAIANIFNRMHNKVRSCKIEEECKETKKSRCDALKKGMNKLYSISQKELLLGRALLATIRDCQTLTIKAYLNKVIID